ncbi:ABC transporter permease [Microvirga lotononidis]|uniref:Permease component of ABC-type sugar transporter n=1 Tax=Microvirga lotononidis TaxID=864069 RepID=I4YYE6_9HYPH|nr:sugar ABC transporter permease [Microvirga lotononidis]EIM28988.1 permease component of ABC-type sugar transporter [Microvirga lotononidis]WQO26903.1 sugar ABC transporter permease [Microvirga lotononidis]
MHPRVLGPALVAPALATVALFFVYPLAYSLVSSVQTPDGWGWANIVKVYELYRSDIIFTVMIIGFSTFMIGLFSTAIGGYLVLGENPRTVAILKWLYRWPLFIPFVVAGQVMRTFLAKNGMLNNTLIRLDLLSPLNAASLLDWRGIIVTFVWKQTPFVALLLSGAMASLDRGTIEAARNLGASRPRILIEIIVPQVRASLTVGLTLSFVTMMSVLSVPLMINAQTPTTITANMAFRINAYGDYGVANALGVISIILTSGVAWLYLRQASRDKSRAVA